MTIDAGCNHPLLLGCTLKVLRLLIILFNVPVSPNQVRQQRAPSRNQRTPGPTGPRLMMSNPAYSVAPNALFLIFPKRPIPTFEGRGYPPASTRRVSQAHSCPRCSLASYAGPPHLPSSQGVQGSPLGPPSSAGPKRCSTSLYLSGLLSSIVFPPGPLPSELAAHHASLSRLAADAIRSTGLP
ncbi:hypothetical protein NDU88_004718 [Pleurodeles waltl]|uniref:Uncharacterized protein n=1 Tax=Pleurodeles waltl TaxID=8319 RepID=A0AAV7V1Y2_PLEWA|nr:hypothetical protein NDU88_004718 [Pleurodeles waltl]